jgi:hypothetical protein
MQIAQDCHVRAAAPGVCGCVLCSPAAVGRGDVIIVMNGARSRNRTRSRWIAGGWPQERYPGSPVRLRPHIKKLYECAQYLFMTNKSPGRAQPM